MASLDDYVQLHEVIECHYLVDCYSAEFLVQDGQRRVARAYGNTIRAALDALNETLAAKTLDEWRGSNAC